jgi:hypothetical protein
MFDLNTSLFKTHALNGDVLLSFIEKAGALGKVDEENWSDDAGNDGDQSLDDENLKAIVSERLAETSGSALDLPIAILACIGRRQL